MQLLWPTVVREQPGFVGRLGRLLHWALSNLGVFFVLGSFFLVERLPDGTADYTRALQSAVIGITAFVTGRAARYLFCAE